MRPQRPLAALTALLIAIPAFADAPVVEDATARASGGAYTFSVTLSHADTGWDDYADGWRVEAADGTILGERPLLHPHVNEQPFTRSQSGIVIPEGTTSVFIRARTNGEGWYDGLYELTLK